MERLDIQLEIDRLNKKINELETDKKKYLNMNKKINDAVSKLKKADEYIYNSYKELAKDYDSEEATKRVESLEEESNNVNSIIKELDKEILAASERKISSLNSEIKKIENEKQELRNQLNGII